ncbi:MAG: MFS transporter, partial [Akkermansiaceae bacterium]
KVGISIGGSLCGWLLGAVGFDPDVEPSDQVIQSFRVIACLLPGALAILNGVVLIWYRLSDEEVEKIAEELEQRRSER